MKLKKAMREYARAVDNLAFATNAIILADMDSCSPEVFGALVHWRDEARKEKKRAVRQVRAVMSAMQYRGEDQIAFPMPRIEVRRLHTTTDYARYIARNRMMNIQGEIYARAIVRWCGGFGENCNTSSLMREVQNVLDEYRFEDGYCRETYW